MVQQPRYLTKQHVQALRTDQRITLVIPAGCSSSPNHSIKIECMAEKCVHNTACCCTASSIDVDGANACTCRDTRCSTFRME